MMNAKTNGLVQTWVPVTDVDGRTRLECQWLEARPAGLATHVGHAA